MNCVSDQHPCAGYIDLVGPCRRIQAFVYKLTGAEEAEFFDEVGCKHYGLFFDVAVR